VCFFDAEEAVCEIAGGATRTGSDTATATATVAKMLNPRRTHSSADINFGAPALALDIDALFFNFMTKSGASARKERGS
jgi:hypothetical protein